MITYIPKQLIYQLISRTNIVDIINICIPLKKQGKNFFACCPFHIEKNPSFTVNYEKQFYHCFSCGSHGNVISFLMNHYKLTFTKAIQRLSEVHNISLENILCNNTNKKNYHTKNLYQFMNDLCTYYQNILIHEKYKYAYQYLKKRGFSDSTIKNFKIGFAPTGWNNIVTHFNYTLYDVDIIDQSGMIISKHEKYDRFRDRIMFPIRDSLGRIIAFGGRIIKHTKNVPKYLNSPDTDLFKKSQNLYGFYETQQNKSIPYILLVEGYIDVITLTQFGINYVISALGTFITNTHIQLIYSITNCIICCYDGDHAGQEAAWRTLNLVLPHLKNDRKIYFSCLPNGEDPDSLIRKIGKKNFLKKVLHTQDLSHFLFNTLTKKINLQTLHGRVKLGQLAIPMINKIPNQILKLCLSQQLGKKIGIFDENKLNQLLKHQHLSTVQLRKDKNHVIYNTEHILISLLIQNPTLAKLVSSTQVLKKCKYNKITIFIELVQTCKSFSIITTDQLLQFYRKQNDKDSFFLQIEMLAHWNHMITNDMIKTTFIDLLTKLYNSILEDQQNMLIARDRTSKLTIQERKELWFLNQTLSKH